MSESPSNAERRRFLSRATCAVGGVAVLGSATPFAMSLLPSDKTRAAAAPLEVDISTLAPGQLSTVAWQGRPVWLLKRTPEQVAGLSRVDSQLADPDSSESQQPTYCKNPHRSIRPELFVSVGLCTHLACAPIYRPDVAPQDLGPGWCGGFYCPCHGSRFDLAGRVYRSMPAPSNLLIPPYRYLGVNRLKIGEDSTG